MGGKFRFRIVILRLGNGKILKKILKKIGRWEEGNLNLKRRGEGERVGEKKRCEERDKSDRVIDKKGTRDKEEESGRKRSR